MLASLFKWRRAEPVVEYTAEVPVDTRVYAIGDIHGRLDLLQAMQAMIRADAETAAVSRKVVVYLGDYVDRGLESRQVIDHLMTNPMDGFDSVHLIGNHEAFLLDFLKDASVGTGWIMNGGDTTLYSYGVGLTLELPTEGRYRQAQHDLREVFPPAQLEFLLAMPHCHIEGDYFFVHAGVKPGVVLEDQDPNDMMWIRGAFLRATNDFGKIVVHGHSISDEVEFRANRIGIDTGAYFSGRLSCLVLEGSDRRLLQT